MEFEVMEEDDPKPVRVVSPAVRLQLLCEGCGKPVERTASQLKKTKHGKPYCSKGCRMKHYNANILERTANQRSKAEDILFGMIVADFPTLNVLANDRETLDGLEIDLYIPSANLAIELNGPVHYMPIYGDERLEQVQMKDARKHLELHQRGIRLLVLDISRLQTRKKTEAFLSEQYTDIIKPLISGSRG